jgi:hypothetical protein
MTKKKLEGRSALGLIAEALIQDHLGPDHKVTDVERFFTALTQALLCGPQDLVQVTAARVSDQGPAQALELPVRFSSRPRPFLREPLNLTIAERGR